VGFSIVWLPADRPREEAGRPALVETARSSASLAILVVEDEPLVARAVSALLRREGHRVRTAGAAEEAVEELTRAPSDFDVVLSDYRMPGMGGEGLFQWMRAHQPDRLERLIFMSGDMLSPRTHAFLEAAGRPVLAKPFTLEALRGALENVPRPEPVSRPGAAPALTPTAP
jgi:CheY-like chemotaxis protein